MADGWVRQELAENHSIGVATLCRDGSVAMANGPRLQGCTFHGMKCSGGTLDVLADDGRTVVIVRLDSGGQARFEHEKDRWYQLIPAVPSRRKGSPFRAAAGWVRKYPKVALLVGGFAGGMLALWLVAAALGPGRPVTDKDEGGGKEEGARAGRGDADRAKPIDAGWKFRISSEDAELVRRMPSAEPIWGYPQAAPHDDSGAAPKDPRPMRSLVGFEWEAGELGVDGCILLPDWDGPEYAMGPEGLKEATAIGLAFKKGNFDIVYHGERTVVDIQYNDDRRKAYIYEQGKWREVPDFDEPRFSEFSIEKKRHCFYDFKERLEDFAEGQRHVSNYRSAYRQLFRKRIRVGGQFEDRLVRLSRRLERHLWLTRSFGDYIGHRLSSLKEESETVSQLFLNGKLPARLRGSYGEIMHDGYTLGFTPLRFLEEFEINEDRIGPEMRSGLLEATLSPADLFAGLMAIQAANESWHLMEDANRELNEVFDAMPLGLVESPGTWSEFLRRRDAAYVKQMEAEGWFIGPEPPQGGPVPYVVMRGDVLFLKGLLGEHLLDYPWPWMALNIGIE